MKNPRTAAAALLLFSMPLVFSADEVRRLGGAGTGNDIFTDSDSMQQPLRRRLLIKTSFIAHRGVPASAYPLKKCQGDCDNDSDCQGHLKCFQRNGGDTRPIPGCYGFGIADRNDYCYDPADGLSTPTNSQPSPVPTKPQPAPAPMKPQPAPVPTKSQPAPVPTKPTPILGKLVYAGDNWQPVSAFPLGLCEGDCDGDSDCSGDLVCHQRDNFDPVPSCSGQGAKNVDYCIHPKDETARPPVPGAFRLKLYWEHGYYWLKEFWEREWCMQCDGDSCGVGDKIFIHYCSDKSSWFLLKNLQNGSTQLQIAASNLCLQLLNNTDIFVEQCDSKAVSQKYVAGEGSFNGAKFELITVSQGGCLRPPHHNDGQLIVQDTCVKARSSNASFWMKY